MFCAAYIIISESCSSDVMSDDVRQLEILLVLRGCTPLSDDLGFKFNQTKSVLYLDNHSPLLVASLFLITHNYSRDCIETSAGSGDVILFQLTTDSLPHSIVAIVAALYSNF